VNANEMDEYNRFGLSPEEMFDDVKVFYSVTDSEIAFRGGAEMRIEDFEESENLQSIRDYNDKYGYQPNTVLLTSNNDSPSVDITDLQDVRKKLQGKDVMIQIQPRA